jgi:hypothetical protein
MTYAVYIDTDNGSFRAGTFSVPGHPNVRQISEAYRKRYPNCDPSKVSFARRVRLFGQMVDDHPLFPMEDD